MIPGEVEGPPESRAPSCLPGISRRYSVKSGSWSVMAACGKRPRKARADGWNSGPVAAQRVHDALDLQTRDLEGSVSAESGSWMIPLHGAPATRPLRVARQARGLDDQGGAVVGDGVGQEADDRLSLGHDTQRDEPLAEEQPAEAGRVFRRHLGALLPGGIGAGTSVTQL